MEEGGKAKCSYGKRGKGGFRGTEVVGGFMRDRMEVGVASFGLATFSPLRYL